MNNLSTITDGFNFLRNFSLQFGLFDNIVYAGGQVSLFNDINETSSILLSIIALDLSIAIQPIKGTGQSDNLIVNEVVKQLSKPLLIFVLVSIRHSNLMV